MKTAKKPLVTFQCPNLGYDVVFAAHSTKDAKKIVRQAREKGRTLVDYLKDEILVTLTLGDFE